MRFSEDGIACPWLLLQMVLVEGRAPRFLVWFVGVCLWFVFSPRRLWTFLIVQASSSDEPWTAFHLTFGCFHPGTCFQQTCCEPTSTFCAVKLLLLRTQVVILILWELG